MIKHTAIHQASEKSNPLTFHAFCCSKKLDAPVRLSVDLETQEDRVQKLDRETQYKSVENGTSLRAWLL